MKCCISAVSTVIMIKESQKKESAVWYDNKLSFMQIFSLKCFHSLKVQKKVVVVIVVFKIHWMIIKFVCTKASKMKEFYEMFAFFISANWSIFLLITDTLRTQRDSENWNKKKREIKPLWQKCVSHDFIDVPKHT